MGRAIGGAAARWRGAYRAAYERFPQDSELGEAGADLLANIVEAESPRS